MAAWLTDTSPSSGRARTTDLMTSMPLPKQLPVEQDVPESVDPAASLASSQAFVDLHRRLIAGGYVEYRPTLANLLGNPKPALMLGHALYWTRNWLRTQPQRDGWFWKPADQWREAVGLTRREQEKARETLREHGLMNEALRGSPAQLFFRVNLDVLCAKLGLTDGPAPNEQTRFDRLAALLEQPVMFFRPLADISGGVIAGLVLSHLLDRYRMAMTRRSVDAYGYFRADVEETRIALSLGPKAQRNAREALRKAGLVQEAWTAEKQSRLMVRLNMQAILACLCGQEHPQRPSRRSPSPAVHTRPKAVPVQQSLLADRAHVVGHTGNVTRVTRLLVATGAKPATKRRLLLDVVDSPPSETRSSTTGGFGESSLALLSKQQGLGSAKGCPFVETRDALLSKLYTKGVISKTTPAPEDEAAHVERPRSSRSLDLPFEGLRPSPLPVESAGGLPLLLPQQLDPVFHAGALELIQKARPELRQPLLDELAGRLSSSVNPLSRPLGWLATLVEKAQAGTVIFTWAPKVAAARAGQAQYERALGAAVRAPAITTASEPQPGAKPSPSALNTIEALRQRHGLRAKRGAE